MSRPAIAATPRLVNPTSVRSHSSLAEHRADLERRNSQKASTPLTPLPANAALKLVHDGDTVETGTQFPPSMPARILVIDDHQIMRDCLCLLLREQTDLALVGSAGDTDGGWAAVAASQPDLIVMDIDIPGEGGTALTARIRAEYPDIKVVVLTGYLEANHVDAALKAGADGYVLKANGCADLLLAMRTVLSGKSYLCPEVSTLVLQEIQRRRPTAQNTQPILTSREIDVLKRMANGFSTKEIAFALELSAKTIETHRANLMAKLGLRSIADLTKYALRNGLVNL